MHLRILLSLVVGAASSARAELVRELTEAETADLRCEICGEPAGGGGALCPVHLEEAGIRA